MFAGCQQPHPELVIDGAGLFEPEQRQRLDLFHSLLLTDHDIDYRVITDRDVGDINEFAARRYAELKVGVTSTKAYGLLLVIDDGGQRVRLEVGYGLEAYFPDAFVAYIENRQMLPFFAANRVSDGILATTELIVDRAQRHALGEDESGETWQLGSGGGGATARQGQYNVSTQNSAAKPHAAGQSPEETLAGYFKAMSERNTDPRLPIYTPETQAMLSHWVMTPAQMDNLLKTYHACMPQPTRYDTSEQLAVIRYPITLRHCAPWFFRRHGSLWQLDLTMMGQAVRFGRDNSWHFDQSIRHPYEFAFDDWQFDRNGFPQK